MDDIQELYAELERLRDELSNAKHELKQYIDGEIRNHVRVDH